MAGALEGIRVLDWTIVQMGPSATRMLSDMGAEVIHIEKRVTGDQARELYRDLKARDGNPLPGGRSAYFEGHNRGKKSITVDVTKEKGKELIYRLVKNSDVFVHNFRQGVPEKLKLDYETLCQYNPKLIFAAASGYGPNGPEAREPTYDNLGMARSGIMTVIGEPGMPPLRIRGAIADQAGAIMTSYGILAALIARDRLGIGQKVDASHLGSMMALQTTTLSMSLILGQEITRENRTKMPNPLWNYYQCQGGRWLVMQMSDEKYWPTMCKGLGIEHLEKDPRFENVEKREENCEELIAIMDEIFLTKSHTEWMKTLKETGDVICTPIQTIADLPDDPQVIANDYIVDCNHKVLGPVKMMGIPFQLSKTPGYIKCEAPELGEHTEEILIQVGGYSKEEVTGLRDEEII
ncbi:CaiB/BaiF CoA transferase family protein [Chloroflexota bacterium]